MGVTENEMLYKKIRRSEGFLPDLLIFLFITLEACRPPLVAQKPKVHLRMHGTPPDAVVIIDDEAVGTLELIQARGIALPVGMHHVTVKAQGYFPWDREVKAEEGQPPVQLDVALMPVPD
jgi:hypothetical protein